MANPRSMLQEWLGELGRDVGIPDIGLDENNYCAVILDGYIVVSLHFEEDTGELIFYTHLCALPHQNRESIYAMLLEGNYFWRETGGATLSIDREGNTVLLAYATPVAVMNSKGFRKSLGYFADTCGRWLTWLEEALQEDLQPPPPTHDIPMIRV